MGIIDRISRLFRANVNAAISAAEQPEKMLNQIILDMRTQLVQAKQQVAGAIADEKRLEDQTRSELREAEEWERRAMLAVKENRDDLAKQAIMRRNEHVSRGQQLQMTWDAHRQETERLKNSLRELNDNIEEANRKKNLLLARQRRAEAQKRSRQTMSSMSDKSAFDAFARMEEKIEMNERQIAASVSLDQEFSRRRALESVQAARIVARATRPRTCSSRSSSRRWACSAPVDRAAAPDAAARRRRGRTGRDQTNDGRETVGLLNVPRVR